MGTPRSEITLRDLLKAGVIEPGEFIEWVRPAKKETYRAVVLADGRVQVHGGASFESLSRAAADLASGQFNGWAVWRVPRLGHVPIGELRTHLTGGRPGGDHGS